ncbi:MAG: plastocyanin/azurin family copper-binding protein [Paracoccaceae bacterium]
MKLTRRTTIAIVAAAMTSLSMSPAFAGTTVHASLWDKGDNSMEMLGTAAPMGMGMMGDMAMAPMGITLDMTEVPAGEITFQATNDSKTMIHEMVLAPVTDPNTPMPYDTANEKVDEDAAGHLGEVAELDPGASGALTLTLKPGTYILYCNIPGHYALGMWTTIKVTG